jgi:formylglycine-generating enzyme required for sulfatase activity
VGGVPQKAHALIGALHAAARATAGDAASVQLFVHPDDHRQIAHLASPTLHLHPASHLTELAQGLVRALQPQPDARALLARLPLDRPPGDPADDHAPPVQADAAALERLANGTQRVRSLVDYALHRWAAWAHEEGGALHLRFVPLRLRDPREGAQPAPGEQAATGAPYTGLPQLLAAVHQRGLQRPLLLRGAPGAGKSTLLQQHEMGLALDFLRRWHRRCAGLDDAPPPQPADAADAAEPASAAPPPGTELPLYLPLRDLPADEPDPLAWLRRQVAEAYPHCAELQALLRQGHLPGPPGVTGQPGLRLRLLLDGLNELPVPAGATRQQRATQLLQRVAKGLPEALPPLLCTRSEHGLDTLLNDRGLAVDVLAWDDAHVRRYVQRRFGAGSAAAKELWNKLNDDPQALALCHTPFNARGQCDLWQGTGRLVAHRGALYRQLLRLALRRELAFKPGTLEPLNPLFHRTELVSLADRECLLDDDAWAADDPPDWPTEGLLLRTLFSQALAQWQGAADVPAHERGLVAVDWDRTSPPGPQVAAELPPALRTLWRQAVNDLGLLAPDAATGRRFAFRHQSWGEYLASVALLERRPAQMPPQRPPQRLARLLADLQAGRGFARSAEDELAHQRAEADARWREPGEAFWRGLFARPIELPMQQVLDGLRRNGYREADLRPLPAEQLAAMNDWQLALHHRMVTPGDDGLVRVDLRAWGERFGIARRADVDVRRDGPWTGVPAAWRVLVLDSLLPPLRDAVFDRADQAAGGAAGRAPLGGQTDERPSARLRASTGGLALPPLADLDEVLGLALLNLPLPDARAWLAWLLARGLWPALRPALAALQRRLEGSTDAAWGPAPDALLQHLRRVLLLRLLDAGAAARAKVQASGQLSLLPQRIQGLPAELDAHWRREWADAFHGTGRDPRERWLAGRMLGVLGDNLRWQRADAATGWGLRLHPRLWARIGTPGRHTRFPLGSPRGEDGAWPDEMPATPVPLPGFEAARLPLTCAEWRRFVEATRRPTGHDDNDTDADDSASVSAGTTPHADDAPPALADADWGAALNPITTITLHQALAYAAWAAPMVAGDNPDPERLTIDLRPPSEAEWEAAQRADAQGQPPARHHRWPGLPADTTPQAMDFNHAATGLRQPSPVGMFSRAYSPAGLADGAGNVWEWCGNALPQGPRPYDAPGSLTEAQAPWDPADSDSPRALRGGACHDTADYCRAACRLHSHPDGLNFGIGVRLVRVWLPHL